MPNRNVHYSAKDKESLYRLIISQLFYDGHQTLAVSISNLVKAHPACPPSDRLFHVVKTGLKATADEEGGKTPSTKRSTKIQPIDYLSGPGIDLEFESDVKASAPEPSLYEMCYVTAHKAPCRTAAISPDGQLAATSSMDASIKILDVERMVTNTSSERFSPKTDPDQESHVVIRSLYDHMEEVTCLEFHPNAQILASGSRDSTIKFFDYSKPSVKRAFKTIQESDVVRCLSFHPSGDYLVVGAWQPTLRLYDVNTGQSFVSIVPADQHKGPITAVKYSQNANMYASASKDGDVKIWDGVSNKCITTYAKAHNGAEVSSVAFSRNSKYLLSSGKDFIVRLWEMATGRCLVTYSGASAKQNRRTQAVFNHTEEYVLFPDEKTIGLFSWDTRTAVRQQSLPMGHKSVIRCIVHSPTAPAFLTCGDDFQVRFWHKKK